jgi:predicted enzyme related to lactoylglutathione lyase
MELNSYEHGVPSWVDLGTSDVAAAEQFYGELFGWQIEQGPPEAGGYATAKLRGRRVAGVAPQQNPGPPTWSCHVNVDDADDIAAKVTAAGGTVLLPPMDVLTEGRFAMFADPQGAAFGVWQPGNHKGAEIVNEPGAFVWSELVTTDVERAKEFYAAVLGWEFETGGDGPDAYTEIKAGGRSVAGMMAKPSSMPAEAPPMWAVYFAVDDVDDTAMHVTKLGGQVLVEPQSMSAGRFAVVTDPQGASFGIFDAGNSLN